MLVIISPVLGFSCFLLLHIIYFRVFKPKNKFSAIVILFSVSLITYVAIRYAISDTMIVSEFAVKLFYFLFSLFLFFGYCTFYSLIDRSVSARINVELCSAGNAGLTLEQIVNCYDEGDSFNRRMKQMQDRGLIVGSGTTGYVLTSKGRTYAATISALKNFMKLGIGG